MSPKATYDTAGLTGAFSKDNMNNQFHSLYQGDSSLLRPRAQAAPNMTVAVASAIAESFYDNIWLNNIASATYAGGNSPAISAPSANPRIDLLYLNSAGALAWLTGVESGSPAAKSFAGYTGIPICLVYCKTTMDRILNYEDKDTDATEGYIYKDIRPQITPILDVASLTEKMTLVADDLFLIEDSESSNVKKKVKKSNISKIIQVVNVQSGTCIHGNINIPLGAAIPQITEGTEVMTLAITPTNVNNKLKIEVVVIAAVASITTNIISALFQDANNNALAAAYAVSSATINMTFTHYMTAGTISSTTFRVRVGCPNDDVNFNATANYNLGGVLSSSITITEITA